MREAKIEHLLVIVVKASGGIAPGQVPRRFVPLCETEGVWYNVFGKKQGLCGITLAELFLCPEDKQRCPSHPAVRAEALRFGTFPVRDVPEGGRVYARGGSPPPPASLPRRVTKKERGETAPVRVPPSSTRRPAFPALPLNQ